MSNFVCEICKKTFKKRENLTYHTEKAVCAGKELSCRFCPAKFRSKSAMYYHMRKDCKIKKKEIKDKEDIYENLIKAQNETKEKILELQNENKKMKEEFEKNNKKHEKEKKEFKKKDKEREKEIKLLKQQINKKEKTNSIQINGNNTNNVSNNINQGVINNVTLIAFGSEDLTKLDKKDVIAAIRCGYNSVTNLTKTIHFNPKYPEYQNIYISNIKDTYAMMYDGKKWNLTFKEDLINRIYEDKKDYIDENFDEFVKSLSESSKNSLRRWLDTDENDKKISLIKKKLKVLLYNERKNVIKGPSVTDTSSSGTPTIATTTNEQIIVPAKKSKG
jgi:hypothetical protein